MMRSEDMGLLKGINASRYPKLVRDNILYLIRASGKDYIATAEKNPMVLTGWIAEKIKEELKEYREASPEHKLEEAADMYEACLALWSLQGLKIEEIIKKAEEKAESKGKFRDGLILWDVIER